MKRLSPKQHGFIDYAPVAANLAMVRLAATPAGKRLVTAAAAGIAGLSLFTDYELGLFRTVPMKTHLTVDTVTGPLLLASPLFLKGRALG